MSDLRMDQPAWPTAHISGLVRLEGSFWTHPLITEPCHPVLQFVNLEAKRQKGSCCYVLGSDRSNAKLHGSKYLKNLGKNRSGRNHFSVQVG